MDVNFKGVVSGIQFGDAITKIEIVWKLGNETEAQAQAAGRGVTWVAGVDDAKIAAYQTPTGQTITGINLPEGAYIPAVRVTESRSGAGAYVGPWTSGAQIAVGSATTTTPGPTTTTTTAAPTTTTTTAAPTTTTTTAGPTTTTTTAAPTTTTTTTAAPTTTTTTAAPGNVLPNGVQANGAVDTITAPDSSSSASIILIHNAGGSINKTAAATYYLSTEMTPEYSAFLRSAAADSLYTWDVQEQSVASNSSDASLPLLFILDNTLTPSETSTLADYIATRKIMVTSYKRSNNMVDIAFLYKDTGGTFHYYDGFVTNAWSSDSASMVTTLSALPARVQVTRDATNYILSVLNATTSAVIKTVTLPISSVINGSSPDWRITGDAQASAGTAMYNWTVKVNQAK